ncbi:MAG: hypothetical protein OZ927_17630 [Alcaligenaceae bacterium]|nr:hypothetical protein [Alcaligenaceae bacterium]
MEYFVILLMILSVYHYVIQTAIIPSLRSTLRYKAFALRDEIRELKIEHGKSMPDSIFHDLQDSINFIISEIWRINIINIIVADKSLREDKEAENRIKQKIVMLDSCELSQVHEIRRKMAMISMQALTVNMLGWWVYIVPIALAASLYKSTRNSVDHLLGAPKLLRERAFSRGLSEKFYSMP